MVIRAHTHLRGHRGRGFAACCLALLTILGGAAGCSSSKSSTSAASGASLSVAGGADRAAGSTGGAYPNGAVPNQAKGAAPAAPAAPSAPNSAAPLPNAAAGRSLVYTATLTVRVKDVAAATAEAERLASANAGFVGDEKSTSGTVPNVAGITQSTVTLRVPADKFDSVLSQLGTGGTVEQQSRSASDVTDQVVDTGSRITSAEASIARITELMKSASGLTDVVSLEGELSRREADLESLKARLASLQDQVQLSTITVTYLVPEAPGTKPAVPKKQNALQRGLHDGWVAFVDVVKVLLIVVGALLPFLVVAAVLWWPVRRFLTWRAAGYPQRVSGRSRGAGVEGPEAEGPGASHAPEPLESQRASGERSSASAAADADGSR